MKTFKIYKHPDQGVEAVKVGFSWPAFIFGLFWMLAKRLWGLAGLWFALYLVGSLGEMVLEKMEPGVVQGAGYILLIIVYFALWLLPAFKGNEWREENLLKRGYELVGTMQAESSEAAITQVAKPA